MRDDQSFRTIAVAALGPQLFLGSEPRLARFKAPSMAPHRPLNKPAGGFWTSTLKTPPSGEIESGWSDWIDWCQSESYGDTTQPRWVVTPDPAAVVALIDHETDLAILLARFRHDSGYGLEYDRNYPTLDYPAMLAAGVDGVHLTDAGQMATRWSNPSLYGWDVESTLWLRWVFTGAPERVG